jgi:pimeloyl-ACP methyl ester carboxylesterase
MSSAATPVSETPTAAEEIQFVLHGRRLTAKRWGNPLGAPTLALHGWLDNASSFDVLAPLLPELSLVALDFAGHGHSDHRPPGINYLGILDVQDVIGVADQLGWASFNLIGHSMGAEVGGNLIGLFPERVPRFIGIDGFTEGTTEARVLESVRQSIASNLTKTSHPPKVFATREALAARVAKATGQSATSAELLVERGSRAVEGGFVWQSDPRVRWSDVLRMSNEQMDGILSRYSGRILVIAAESGSQWYRPTLSNRIGRFPNLRVVEVPGNHHLHMDQATAVRVAEVARAFLSE